MLRLRGGDAKWSASAVCVVAPTRLLTAANFTGSLRYEYRKSGSHALVSVKNDQVELTKSFVDMDQLRGCADEKLR